jgi:rSAM/selenodomain-associated transferase 1
MVELQDQDVVAVLTRAPSAGGKTRLFADLGRPPDPAFLAALFLDTLDAVASPGVTRAVCFSPPHAEAELKGIAPPGVLLLAQRGEDLGARMRFAFDDLFLRGARSVVLVGSDVPALPPDVVPHAFRALRHSPDAVVLGPARDGGYYLIGATRTPTHLFSGMRWSEAHVFDETCRRAARAGIDVVRIAEGWDVDTVNDLRALLKGAAPALRTRAICGAYDCNS